MKSLYLLTLLALLLAGCRINTTVEGAGTITSASGNFNCINNVGTCTKEYLTAGAEVFTAVPAPGWTFAKWTGCNYVSITSCGTSFGVNTTDQAWTITATFKPINPPVQAAQYTYNALEQRITKKVGSTVTVFQYDLDGNLMVELTASGQPLRQHVHVNGEPVAQLTTNPADGTLSVQYVHADHLGTPTLLTNQSGIVVADIEAEPFGETYIDYSELTHNRRLPGQYRDEETGLHYNYFRDYDPTTGRYVQSDPIGLAGGDLNTYAYAEGNALRYADPLGLWVKRCARTLAFINKDKPAMKPSGINTIRHDYISVSGNVFSFQTGTDALGPLWSQGYIDSNELPDNPKCEMVCKDDKFDKYVSKAAAKLGKPKYAIDAYPGRLTHSLGARNCHTWTNDVLIMAKADYLRHEECPKCFK